MRVNGDFYGSAQDVRDTISVLEEMLQDEELMLEWLYPKEYQGICCALQILYDVADNITG